MMVFEEKHFVLFLWQMGTLCLMKWHCYIFWSRWRNMFFSHVTSAQPLVNIWEKTLMSHRKRKRKLIIKKACLINRVHETVVNLLAQQGPMKLLLSFALSVILYLDLWFNTNSWIVRINTEKKLIFLQSFKNRNITIFIIIIGKVLSTLLLVY